MKVLGIDIGGSGIKGAPVDTEKGMMTTARYRIPTPQPSTPEAVAETVTEASLQRRESRGAHQRLDYTERDDSTYLKHSLCFQQADGCHHLFVPVQSHDREAVCAGPSLAPAALAFPEAVKGNFPIIISKPALIAFSSVSPTEATSGLV